MLIIYKLLQVDHGDGRDLGAVGDDHDADSNGVLGDTNFLNILPQPMMIVKKAWWTATTMLSISTKSHIFRILSFSTRCLWSLVRQARISADQPVVTNM